MSLHSFDPDIAEIVGVIPAVLYQNLLFWTEKNAANDKHFHEGRYWTYNSNKAFELMFPYLSGKQIRGALKKLIDAELIADGNFNSSAYDRTKWFCLLGEPHLPKRENGFTQKGEPIPDIKPDIKPDIRTPLPQNGNLVSETPTQKTANEVRETLLTVLSPDVADAYIEHRRSKRAAMTSRAASLIAKKLAQCPNADAVAENSIANGWTGVFPDSVKDQPNGKPNNSAEWLNSFVAGATQQSPMDSPEGNHPALTLLAGQ